MTASLVLSEWGVIYKLTAGKKVLSVYLSIQPFVCVFIYPILTEHSLNAMLCANLQRHRDWSLKLSAEVQAVMCTQRRIEFVEEVPCC